MKKIFYYYYLLILTSFVQWLKILTYKVTKYRMDEHSKSDITSGE